MKRAFITGITGQDGSYLAELLLEKGYEVHGMIRRASTFNTGRIDHIFDKLRLYHGDMTDSGCLRHILQKVKPDEIYNLAAQSHVRVSFEQPEYTADVTGMGALKLFEAVRDICPKASVYQASSSEMFGSSAPKQNETTPFKPMSPYACAKVFAHNMAISYRKAYGLKISCGILFNHESERRGETFVTRKITKAVARIKTGLQKKLALGNRTSLRDWGYAPEYVEAMWLMLQKKDPGDYVIATGESRTVQDFLELAFERVNLDWRKYVMYDPKYVRPVEVDNLCGDPSKAKRLLGWQSLLRFDELVNVMVDHDLAAVKKAPVEVGAE